MVEGDIRCGFGDEEEGALEAEEVAFVGFDAAFYAGHLMVAAEVV